MDNSYPVTPYPLSPYGSPTEEQQVNARTQQMYLITPPTPTPSSPPSQAATLVREPIMIRSDDSYVFANAISAMHPHQAGAIPQQPINTAQSPPQLKPLQYSTQGSYEPMPGLSPTTTAANNGGGEHHGHVSPPPLAFIRPSRLRPASDMPIYASYYPHVVRNQMHSEQLVSDMKPQKSSKPTVQPSSSSSSANGLIQMHANVGRVLLPYWMLLSLGLLIAMTSLMGRLLVVHSSLEKAIEHSAANAFEVPVMPDAQVVPVIAPTLEEKKVKAPLAKPRALHSAPIPPLHRS